jgi:hypothetical protein
LLLHPITWYFLLFSPGPKRQSQRFLRRALGREPTLADHYAQVHSFASVVLDRVYLARGRTDRFDIEVHGGDELLRILDQGRGAFLVGAHLGSFEVLHAAGKGQNLRVAMVMFPDNARLIQGVLAAVAPQMSLEIIAIGRPGSTLAIRDWLDQGGLVGVLGDRTLPAGLAARGPRSQDQTLPFLGLPARFNDGPFRLAQLLGREVLLMCGLFRGGNRYEVRFERLERLERIEPLERPEQHERIERPADAGAAGAAARSGDKVSAALAAYVAWLEGLARESPENWFNFHDFWEEDGAA